MILKSDVKEFYIHDTRPDFDKACEQAYSWAKELFEIDDYGHAKDNRFPRSSSTLHVQFIKYKQTRSMAGGGYVYTFTAWMEANK